ncbi:hypothetical protein ACFTZ8_35545 [Streptomyces fungicidicus]|uniref:Spore-associated protein A n=1 Tax=Streptomyces griseoflavus Tu4000 TaxID=467200 RepID=D9Y1J5_9ACTN|nr:MULTISPECIES: hypothetical protein [Streptomyces]EFL40079.1 hypothetical protein SSRG_02883 [Streptomyces griseoflavus Tu4000]QKW01705.1 hypothetical protein HUT14_18545 [Streptomyces sp. NA02536]TQL21162.1 hypothetical protein FBY37_3136 [Streptomyces sp. SLBN-134]
MRRTLATAAALTLSFTGLGVATAPGAFAATAGASEYGCPGSLIDTYNTPASGEVWGQLRLYYSSANGGTNCAVLLAKKYYGKSHYMEVGINITGSSNNKLDYGAYSYYAGPVTVTSTNGHCIDLGGGEDNGGIWAGRSLKGVHCG